MARVTVGEDEDLHHILHRLGKSHLLDAVLRAPENKRVFVTGHAALLHAGDEIEIPDEEPRSVICSTNAEHRFRARPPERRLQLRLTDRHGAARSGHYRVTFTGGSCEGDLSDGHLDAALPVTVTEAQLQLGDDHFTLHVGRLDPVDTTTGLRGRLRNLGLLGGDDTDAFDDSVRAAISHFQLRHRLPVTGQADPATRRKLLEIHGA